MPHRLENVNAVVFDLGGTLVEHHLGPAGGPGWDPAAVWSRVHAALAESGAPELPAVEHFARALEEAEAAIWSRITQDQRSGNVRRVVRSAVTALGLVESDALLEALESHYEHVVTGAGRPYPDAAPTLRALKARGLRLGLLSNTWWQGAWHDAELAEAGLLDLLDGRVYSSEIDYTKPHPEAFAAALDAIGAVPERTVFVGDRLFDDIFGAQQAGLFAVWRRYPSNPVPAFEVRPDAEIDNLAELLPLLGVLAS